MRAARSAAPPRTRCALPGAPKCPIFPATNAWNERVDTLPVAANSAQLIQSIGLGTGLHPDFGSGLYDGQPIGIPFDVVSKTDEALRACSSTTPTSRTRGRIRSRRRCTSKAGARRPATGTRCCIDKDACKLYELYALYPKGGGWTAGSGAIWNLRSNALRPAGWTSADAAGLPIFPGLARYDEVARGVIDHALRFTAARTRQAVRLSGAALRVVVGRSVAAADGPARAAEGVGRHLGLPEAGAHRAAGAEDVRDDPRRQRLELVHQRRARTRTGRTTTCTRSARITGSDFEVVDTSSLPHPGQ